MSIHFKEFPGLIWKNSMTPPGFDIDCNWTTRWHRHACTVPFSSCHGFCAELNPAQNPDIKIHDLAFMHVMAALLYRWKHSGVSALNQAQFAVYESVLKSWTWVYIFSWHFQDFWEILLYFPWFPGLEFDDLKFQVFQEVHEPRACQACPEEKCSKKRINNIQRVSEERNLQKELFPLAVVRHSNAVIIKIKLFWIQPLVSNSLDEHCLDYLWIKAHKTLECKVQNTKKWVKIMAITLWFGLSQCFDSVEFMTRQKILRPFSHAWSGTAPRSRDVSSTITPKFLLPKSASTADGVSTSQLTDPPDPVPLPCARISIILQAMWSSGMHLFIISPHDSAGWVFLKNLSDLLHVRHSKVTQSHRWSMAVAMLMMIVHISAHGWIQLSEAACWSRQHDVSKLWFKTSNACRNMKNN